MMFRRSSAKYGNTKTIVGTILFHSKHEAKDYMDLRLEEKAGKIKDLVLQPKFVLQEKFTDRSGTKHREIIYIADFGYTRVKTNEQCIQDSKGMRTKDFIIKKKLFLFKYPHYTFIES